MRLARLVPLLALASCSGTPAPYTPSPNDRRLLVEASALAVLSEEHPTDALPTVVTLGGAREPAVLFVRFERRWAGTGKLRAAFLHLSARQGAPAPTQATTLHTSRISAAWQLQDLNWSNRPSLGPPYASANAAPQADVRIDVTALVSSADLHPDEDFGMAVSGERSAGGEVSYATGAGGGRGPELEVFLRER